MILSIVYFVVPSIASTINIPQIPLSLNFTSPLPHVFHSISTLLQTLPQNQFPNGHTIASVTIPRHTLLYHGRHDNDPVPSPEWLAFDIEMAYGIMGSMQDSRMLMYRTTRDVKAVYFDGASANLMGEGTMSQMVLLFNGSDDVPKRGGFGPPVAAIGHLGGYDDDVPENEDDGPPKRPPGPPGGWNPLKDEYLRARGLCEWLQDRELGGKGWGYEALVRMNAGFEVIWCDFESLSLNLVSNLNVSAPLLNDSTTTFPTLSFGVGSSNTQHIFIPNDEGPHGPGMTDPREPFRTSASWSWFDAASKRYFGDSRIELDSCGIFSFYDPHLHSQSEARTKADVSRLNLTADGRLQGSDAEFEEGDILQIIRRRRRQHTLNHVAAEDGIFMLRTLEQRLRHALSAPQKCGQLQWHRIMREIKLQYSDALQDLAHKLKEGLSIALDDITPVASWLQSIRQSTHRLLIPFLEYPAGRPYKKDELKQIFDMNSALAISTFENCQSQYEIDGSQLRDEEILLHASVEEVLVGICSTVVQVGLGMEHQWLLDFNEPHPSEDMGDRDVTSNMMSLAQEWKRKIEVLMAWLGWVDAWTACDPACKPSYSCYIPMWPTSGFTHRPGHPRKRPGERNFAMLPGDWGDSEFLWKPVCVNASSYPPEEWKER